MLLVLRKPLLLACYLHFRSALEEAKNIARIFSIYFENNFLKNEN